MTLAVALLALKTFISALSAAWDITDYPEFLLVKAEAWPRIFSIHMATGGFALLLVPAAVVLSGTRWHRLVAPLAAADVVVAGLTSAPVALESPVTRIAAAGFLTQAVVWLALLALGVAAIRRGDAERHRRYMLQMAAVTFGAMIFRVYLAVWVATFGYAYLKTFYSCDAWAAWLSGLAAMRFWLYRRDQTLDVQQRLPVA